jgi:UTP:GlnB (protein PII) uridylyltransferase
MLLLYHPESKEQLAWGSDAPRTIIRERDPSKPLGAQTRGIQTQVEVREADDGSHSILLVNTLDRPGLLTDIVRILKDISLNVVSAEIDTIGRNAVDTLSVTYHGEPLNQSMCQLAVNALQYYLSQTEVEKDWEESY